MGSPNSELDASLPYSTPEIVQQFRRGSKAVAGANGLVRTHGAWDAWLTERRRARRVAQFTELPAAEGVAVSLAGFAAIPAIHG